MKNEIFAVGSVLKINGQKFTVTKARDCAEFPGTQVLVGTFEKDPSFLAGKRTIFTAYLRASKNAYLYDQSAK